MKPVFWTSNPSRYQRAFFQSLRNAGIDTRIRYYSEMPKYRSEMGWDSALENADEEYAPDCVNSLSHIPDWKECLHVLTGYRDLQIRRLMARLCAEKAQWAHWSERTHPGVRWFASYAAKRRYAKALTQYGLGAFAIGKSATDDFIRWGIPQHRIAFLPYVTASPPEEEIVEDKLCKNFLKGRRAFIFLGQMCHRKGVDLLLRSFAAVSSISDKWALVIVGSGPRAQAHESLAAQLGIAKKVLFRGPVPTANIAQVLALASVLVLPSRYDGWGAVLNEAISVGLAVIGTNACGASEHMIEPGANGFIVESNNLNSLTVAMAAYVQNSKLSASHGAYSLKVAARFTPEGNVERFVNAVSAWTGLDHIS